jgi:hypothetical protein
MVIRTEYRGQRYSMGRSDPLPDGFEIRFGSLNFQDTGNGYLMRLINREELRARRQAGSVPVAVARVAATPTPASARDRRGRSAGMLRVSPRNAMRSPARQQPPGRGSARSQDRASPSVCVTPRPPKPHRPALP